jgi:hypothetical protein
MPNLREHWKDGGGPMRRERLEPPPLSLGWKIWFAFCALLGVGVLSLVVWLVLTVISYLRRH